MANKKQTYEERVNRILTTSNHEEPDRVPILAMFETWCIGYANGTIREMEEDYEKEIEYYTRPYDDIYTDAAYGTGLGFDAKSAEILGSPAHFISSDGQTVQHMETCLMEDDEYQELIADPYGYTFNKMVPRKNANLNKTPEENYETMKKLFVHWKKKSAVQARLREKLKEEYNIPLIFGGSAYPPMDYIFDYYRGFKGTSMDMRRQKDNLEAAVEAVLEVSTDLMGLTPEMTSVPEFPFYTTMMNIPTFVSPKQFERFFWPTYEKMWRRIYDLGGKLIIFLEGTWKNKYDYLNSFPKNFALGILEDDDIFEAKKLIGDNMTIIGGMDLGLLKLGTQEECIDHAKKLLDVCAPGGGYIFGTPRTLLSKGDVNVENLNAVHNFVHESAVYK